MGGLIPRQFIDELLRRTDIVELIDSRVPLKKTGSNYQALCPFHNEKSPSFSVNPDKQFYHCFGCQASGSAIGFLMEYDNMDFVEVVEELAQRAGLEVPREVNYQEGPDNGDLYDLLEQASQIFQGWLRNHKDSAKAVEYLKGRGLSGEIAAEYQLGYAPPGWDNLKRSLADGRGAVEAKMLQGGLLTEKEDRSYDRFRDRIIFPIRDARGRTIGFGGRVMGDDKPKYLNSPETPIFHKGSELYGLHEARKAMRKITSMLVVEGYMDVIALAQFGVRNCVATLGTATSSDHLERLFRIVSEVVFCFDGDQAGRDAAWKALNTGLPLMKDGRNLGFLFLPDGEDPDSLIRAEGKEGLESRIRQAMPLSEFLFKRLQESIDISSAEGRAKLADQAAPLISKLPKGVYHELLQARLNELVPVGFNLPAAPAPQKRRIQRPERGGDRRISMQRKAITCLIQYPSVADQPDFAEEWRKLDEPGIPLLAEMFDLARSAEGITTARMLEHWSGREEYAALRKLATMDLEISEDKVAAEFLDALRRMDEKYRKQQRDFLLEEQLRQALNRG